MESLPGRSDLVAHHTASYGWALACTAGNRDEAETVLQTSYLRVLDGSARFEGRSAFRTFLFGVIRNVAAARRRKHLVERFLLLRHLSTAPSRPSATDPRTDDEAVAVRQALSRLPGRQREVLHLVFYEDLTIEEASRSSSPGRTPPAHPRDSPASSFPLASLAPSVSPSFSGPRGRIRDRSPDGTLRRPLSFSPRRPNS